MLDANLNGTLGELTIDLTIAVDRRTLAIIGPNGAGKTTLLRMLLGVVPVRRGRITAGERVLLDRETGVDVAPEARRFGYVPQQYALFPHMSVADNVGFGLAARRVAVDERQRRVAAVLEQLEVEHLATRMATELSGGERQRVALARALAIEPAALLLDEPLAALDRTVRRRMREFLVDHLADVDVPTLLVTHDPADVVALADEVGVLESGRIVQRGDTAAVRDEPATRFARQFFRAGET